MINLSVELIEKIFHPLHQRDKVECLTVCRAWKQVLENTVLFKTIRLQSKDQLNNLVNKLRRDPIKSNHVHKIILEIQDIESSEIDILGFLFVNIRELVFYGSADSDYKLRFTKILSPHPWIRTIKSIIEPSSQVFTEYLLERGTCPALTEVTMCGKAQQLGKELIDLFGKAPALKTLALQKYSLALTDLELLHNKVPLLSSLSLDDISINCDTLPVEVESAEYMTKLSLKRVRTSTTEKYIDFQKYVTQKYPKIVNMVYSVTVESGVNLADYMITGFIPQIQQIAPHLTALDISHPKHIQYIIPTLDQNNCQLKELAIGNGEWTDKAEINEIVKSKQAQSIQKLSLHTIPDYVFLDLPKLIALTMLHISYEKDPGGIQVVFFDQIMTVVGNTISTLELAHVQLSLNTSSVTKYPCLKKLKLKAVEMAVNTDVFISRSFPNLRALTIDDCVWDMTSSFYFGDLNLSYLEFRDPIVISQGEKVLIVTLCNNEKRWYSGNKVSTLNRHPTGNPSNFPAVESLPYNKYVGLPYLIILCHSLHDFFLVNTL